MPQPPTNQATSQETPLETTELLGPLPSIAQAISWATETSSESSIEQLLPLPPRSSLPKRSCPYNESLSDEVNPDVDMETTRPASTDVIRLDPSDMPRPPPADVTMLALDNDDSHTTLAENEANATDVPADDSPFYMDSQEVAETSPGSVDKVMASFLQTTVQDNIPETIPETNVMNTPAPLGTTPLTTTTCGSQLTHALSQPPASDASSLPADVMTLGSPDSASSIHDRDSVDSIFEACSNFGDQEELYHSLFLCYFNEFHITLSDSATLLAQLLAQHNMILAFDQPMTDASSLQCCSEFSALDSILQLCPLPEYTALLLAYVDAYHLNFAQSIHLATSWGAVHCPIYNAFLMARNPALHTPSVTR